MRQKKYSLVFHTVASKVSVLREEQTYMTELGFKLPDQTHRVTESSTGSLIPSGGDTGASTLGKLQEEQEVDYVTESHFATLEQIKEHAQKALAPNLPQWRTMASGLQRPHFKGKLTSRHVLNADLAGQHTPSASHGFRYALVAVYDVEHK